jgi:hypothetical protein
MNTASNTRLRLNYKSWPRPHSHWSATGHRNQHTAFQPILTNTHSGNLHNLLPMLHRSDRWLAPVRRVAPVRPVDIANQVSGYSSRTTNVPGSLSDSSRPWNRNTLKTEPARKKNPTQSQAKQLQTYQELTNNNTTQRHTNQAIHLMQIPQRAHIGHTGQ